MIKADDEETQIVQTKKKEGLMALEQHQCE